MIAGSVKAGRITPAAQELDRQGCHFVGCPHSAIIAGIRFWATRFGVGIHPSLDQHLTSLAQVLVAGFCQSPPGAYALVGAGSVVVGDVPAGSVVVGNPARVIKHVVDLGEYSLPEDL